jgi:hypothetical protein
MENFLSGLNGFLGTANTAYQATVNSDAQKKLAAAQSKQANAQMLSADAMKKIALYGGIGVGVLAVVYFATRGKGK